VLSPTAPTPTVPYSADDIDTVARTIWGEARGEGALGLRAVAHVIKNRVMRPRWWGRNWRQVCTRPAQFSCWLVNDPNRDLLRKVGFTDPMYRQAYAIAASVMAGLDAEDITRGADHYHAAGIEPAWLDASRRTGAIGHHIFYRLEA
jgi:N-acetylmuramoyl-L-alanine amidase